MIVLRRPVMTPLSLPLAPLTPHPSPLTHEFQISNSYYVKRLPRDYPLITLVPS